MTFQELEEFKRDKKLLAKKYRTLSDDLEIVKRILELNPDERPPFSYRIDQLGIQTCIIKVRKIACRALKGKGTNSGLRLVYAYFPKEAKIILVEIYHKNESNMEDRARIIRFFT